MERHAHHKLTCCMCHLQVGRTLSMMDGAPGGSLGFPGMPRGGAFSPTGYPGPGGRYSMEGGAGGLHFALQPGQHGYGAGASGQLQHPFPGSSGSAGGHVSGRRASINGPGPIYMAPGE